MDGGRRFRAALAVVAAAACLLLHPLRAGAASWRIDPARTVIAFAIDAVGYPRTEGRFTTFDGRIAVDFDRGRPELPLHLQAQRCQAIPGRGRGHDGQDLLRRVACGARRRITARWNKVAPGNPHASRPSAASLSLGRGAALPPPGEGGAQRRMRACRANPPQFIRSTLSQLEDQKQRTSASACARRKSASASFAAAASRKIPPSWLGAWLTDATVSPAT